MTYREIMKQQHPDLCGPDYVGGCAGCPGDILPSWPMEKGNGCLCNEHVTDELCRRCWNSEIPDKRKDPTD